MGGKPAGHKAAMLIVLALLGGCIPDPLRPDPGYRDPPAQDRYPEPPAYYERQRADDGVETLRTAPPAWQARAVEADARTIEPGNYLVQPGDTLRAIGDKTGAGSEAIASANGLAPPYVIRPGDRLVIPGGRYHLVRQGETGIAIARAYAVAWSRIVTANGLSEPYILRVGMRVLIPGGAPTLAERAAAFRLDVDDIVTGGEPALASDERPSPPSSSPSRILPSSAAISAPARLRGGFSWPVHGRIVSKFGPGASGERNNGVKIAVPPDTPVLAAADGVVAYAGDEIPSLGGLVIIKHGDGWTTVYGHARQLLVQRGQSVKRGQTIALSGDSGNATRPELHYEMRKGRTPVDPITQMPPI